MFLSREDEGCGGNVRVLDVRSGCLSVCLSAGKKCLTSCYVAAAGGEIYVDLCVARTHLFYSLSCSRSFPRILAPKI